ncbi:flagellar basal body L-ring protein FlgH [Pleionea sp. CnH1-48]|uniref:flagellar basal body L-ring protein FlgH n=1 Tax=Pleionea sp. CnH1-48 TaxID=2954494 RepID=UPI002096922F|nr:flagellar basal body L-ring protein FlgH [Pleionea sp. CnH1-48]MCO7223718.1 flagellar basal body L-ring protein FlgH [Pleionea sp. CnH1-48]
MKILISTLIIVLIASSGLMAEDLFEAKRYRSLTADKKAFRVGDTVTILIVERTTAETRANTSTDKSINFDGDSFDNTRINDLGLGLSSGTEGDAVTRRNGFLTGQITAAVIDVNKLGHLVVEGRQVIVINGEEQSIKVQGTLRQEDIANNNTVVSSRLTNARIEFTGKGIVSDAQEKGIIARIFDWLGLL